MCRRLERLMGRLWKGGFLPAQAWSFGDLAVEADRKLFRAVVTDPRHVLSRLLPEVKSTSRAVKSCQKTHPGNRSRQHRLTMYT